MDRSILVFGQMNESSGARLRVGSTAITMAEYFRDQEQRDVLIFIDNVYRFAQAGMEVSALLGRIPSGGWLPADSRAARWARSRSGSSTRTGGGDQHPGRLRPRLMTSPIRARQPPSVTWTPWPSSRVIWRVKGCIRPWTRWRRPRHC